MGLKGLNLPKEIPQGEKTQSEEKIQLYIQVSLLQ